MALLVWQSPGHARGLQPEEQLVAESIAAQAPWEQHTGKRLSHPLGVQILFTEKPESKHETLERFARVYQYDYTRQSARLLDINLVTHSVTRVQAIDSVHLPLSNEEIAFASGLLAQNDALLARLRSEQSQRGSTPFVLLSELDVKASIYEPLDSDHPCALSRCALLSLFDHSHTVFSIEPLIYLNSQGVGELHP